MNIQALVPEGGGITFSRFWIPFVRKPSPLALGAAGLSTELAFRGSPVLGRGRERQTLVFLKLTLSTPLRWSHALTGNTDRNVPHGTAHHRPGLDTTQMRMSWRAGQSLTVPLTVGRSTGVRVNHLRSGPRRRSGPSGCPGGVAQVQGRVGAGAL